MSSCRGISVLEVLIVIAVLVILVSVFFPVASGPDSSRKSQAKNDVAQIATAVVAFETEYGHLPGTSSGDVGGKVLAALMGSNLTLNPRKIVFLEVTPAKKHKSGISNGSFVDPWGGIYQIAYASGTNQQVLAGTNGIEVKRRRVGVWSDPELGKEGWGYKPKKQRRYVTSWD